MWTIWGDSQRSDALAKRALLLPAVEPQHPPPKGEGHQEDGAEFFGTFSLVLGGCGSAVLAAAFPNLGIGLLGVSLAFGLWAGGRFPASQLLPYIAAQVFGADCRRVARCGNLPFHWQREGLRCVMPDNRVNPDSTKRR